MFCGVSEDNGPEWRAAHLGADLLKLTEAYATSSFSLCSLGSADPTLE